MSIRVMSHVWDFGPENQSELLVLLALADHADENGKCWPSMERIARKARMSIRTARRTIRKLEAAGLVSVSVSVGRSSNQYIVHMGNPDTMAGSGSKPGQSVRSTRPQLCPPNPDKAVADKSSKNHQRKTRTRDDAPEGSSRERCSPQAATEIAKVFLERARNAKN